MVALVVLYLFRKELRKKLFHGLFGGIIALLLIGGLFFGESIALTFEQKIYKDPIIHLEESSYQKIILTKRDQDVRLYLDGSLQLSSIDEHRYHEVLVHPTIANTDSPEKILVLGGGDGLAARELLKYSEVEEIILVDLDPAVVELANTNPYLTELNERSLMNSKVQVLNRDAFEFLEESEAWFDAIIVDLPDPNNESLNKLYTKEFYSLIRNHLKPSGTAMIQATSPVFAREVYWTISNTVEATGLFVENLHVDVPSFGNWGGFVMASREPIDFDNLNMEVETNYLDEDTVNSLTAFGKDEDRNILDNNGEQKNIGVNTLIDPLLIPLYEKSWDYY
ncbi:spermidine synthase [Gracilibacillus boraciitolerans JCM 21714]|uniref:Polyamine aminopropyltransferase n=1 Tax=Gracilibacillus boraciitolerans JCM 21714 TaxID=1298598 RepID=W4VIK2_9BACI|nr:spermidine synthase [Gracilibacillus boraciitolerans JCM 21714]